MVKKEKATKEEKTNEKGIKNPNELKKVTKIIQILIDGDRMRSNAYNFDDTPLDFTVYNTALMETMLLNLKAHGMSKDIVLKMIEEAYDKVGVTNGKEKPSKEDK